MLVGKLSSVRSHQMLNSWSNSPSWQWDQVSLPIKFWQLTPSDACSPLDSRTPGTSLEHFTMPLLNSDTHPQSNPMLTNTTHTSAHAPMMPTTFLLYWEDPTHLLKPSWVTAQKLHQMPLKLLENFDKSNRTNTSYIYHHLFFKWLILVVLNIKLNEYSQIIIYIY